MDPYNHPLKKWAAKSCLLVSQEFNPSLIEAHGNVAIDFTADPSGKYLFTPLLRSPSPTALSSSVSLGWFIGLSHSAQGTNCSLREEPSYKASALNVQRLATGPSPIKVGAAVRFL